MSRHDIIYKAIPVKRRLPKKFGQYICLYTIKEHGKRIFEGQYNFNGDGLFWKFEFNSAAHIITHWLERQEPAKK